MKCTIAELSTNGVARGKVSNNYASLECGAKVISTNKEASVSPICCSTREDYSFSILEPEGYPSREQRYVHVKSLFC